MKRIELKMFEINRAVPYAEVYLGPCQTSMVQLFIEIKYDYLLTIFAKHLITDVLHDPQYTSAQGTSLLISNIFDFLYVLYINPLVQFSGIRGVQTFR